MYTTDEINDFYKNYRESLSRQNEVGQQNLLQQRRNAQASIMSGANKAGMLYSNFPQRSKIQYDVQTYDPARIKLQTTYQTGLDKLRDSVLSKQNAIREIQENIAHLNSLR